MDHRIHIPFDVLEDYIQCSICLSVIRGAILTPCGHRYCNRCITEWVGRNHTCPCCNSALNTSQFYYDVQFDSLVEATLTERDKKEQQHFDKMFTGGGNDEKDDSNANVFEGILKKHLKRSFVSHQQYFAKLREDYDRQIQLLNIGSTQLTAQIDEITLHGQTSDEMKQTLTKNLEESERFAADAFDKYLSENLPNLEVMPISVSVYVGNKDIRVENVIIKPTDKLSVIKSYVETAMQKRSDDLVSWTENGGTLLLVGPLSKSDQYNLDNVKKLVGQKHDIHLLSWESRPVLQYSLRPGSEIILIDTFRSQSDLPKNCFVKMYDKSGSQACDYFFCQNCNVKWICKSCIQCCHTGHEVLPFAMQHKPSWACCYCPKKKMCKIQNPDAQTTSTSP